MRRVLLILSVSLMIGCADQVVRETQNFDRPTDIAFACFRPARDGGSPTPIPEAACDPTRHQVYGFVSNTIEGDVAVIDILARRNIDVTRWIPGFTRAPVGDMPEAIAAHPTGRFCFTANRGSGDLSRLATHPGGDYEVLTQPLPHAPYDIVIGPNPVFSEDNLQAFDDFRALAASRPNAAAFDAQFSEEFQLELQEWEDHLSSAVENVAWAAFLSTPHDASVLIVPLSSPDIPQDEDPFGSLGFADMWRIPLDDGVPARLELANDGRTLFLTHFERSYISAVTLATGVEEKIHLSPPCDDPVSSESPAQEDFSCYQPAGDLPSKAVPHDLVSLAVSPDDKYLYVLDRTAFEVLVVRWPEGELVDVLAHTETNTPELGADPVRRREGGRGLPLLTAPQDIGFVALPDEGVVAYVSEISGRTTLLEFKRPGLRCPEDDPDGSYRVAPRETHRIGAADRYAEPSVTQPMLLRGDEEIDLAFALIPSLPSMGPFRIRRVDPAEYYPPRRPEDTARDETGEDLQETIECAGGVTFDHPWLSHRTGDPRIWYGVRLSDTNRLVRSESWTVRYEGELPGTQSTGQLTSGGALHDPAVDYCELGVEPGDLLLVRTDQRHTCGDYDGILFEWPIVDLSADELYLGAPGRSFIERTPGDDDDWDETELVVNESDLPLPDPECFAGPLEYAVRAREQYVITGSQSGYLHNWHNVEGRCEKRPDADSRFVGRTTEARKRPDVTLPDCPPPADGFEDFYEGDFFENFALRFRMYPGCERDPDGDVVSLDGETERDVAWQFRVTSAFAPQQFRTGRLPARVIPLSLPGYRRAFIVDSAGRAVFELDATYGASVLRHTFF